MRPSIAALRVTRGMDADALWRLVDAFKATAAAANANRGTLIAAAIHLATETAPGEKTGLIDLLRCVAGRQHDRRETGKGRT